MEHYLYIKSRARRPMIRSLLISFVLMGMGGMVLIWSFWPIVSFHFFEGALLAVTSPLADTYASSPLPPAGTVYASDKQAPGNLQSLDYTNANVWFPLQPQKKVSAKVTAYTLSIPKLGIKDAYVVIGGDDLNHSLVHYGGTALPGENGNGVIFGHSVLPQFFNQKNYKTIFSTIPTLEIGDSIYINYDSVTYQYKVERLTVHEPDDLSVLEQQYDDSYITLVTCVPPGTFWQRLNVRARLFKI